MTEHISDLNLPWKLDIRSGCLAIYPAKDGDKHYCLAGGNKWAIHFKEGKRICDEDGKLVTWEMDQMDIARASFIVRACNSHAALLEALNWSYCELEQSDFSREDVLEVLAKAIRQTEEQS